MSALGNRSAGGVDGLRRFGHCSAVAGKHPAAPLSFADAGGGECAGATMLLNSARPARAKLAQGAARG